MKLRLFLIFVLVIICSSLVSADVLMPGTKGINNCFKVSNINDYPNYKFILYHELVGGWQILEENKCFDFYKINFPSLYAIRNTDFNEKELSKDYNIYSKYFENNPKLISSNIKLDRKSAVSENDPLKGMTEILKVIGIDDNKLEIEKEKVIYEYVNGTSEIKYYTTQDSRPEPSRKAILPWWVSRFWYVLVPLIALVLIFFIWLFKRKR